LNNADHGCRDPAAVVIARKLTARHGAKALHMAIGRQRSAVEQQDATGADLYLAVCTVLADRDQVFSRWQARQPKG